ncbi:carbohydrate ABC transporter permease [Phaeobacter gallaeciensis]|uniref:Carbohydrate ABC transporter membrane protein 2, CUT1 family n=1 Tax=Phaeobacter gallaeciensis TaxID=60890 RepID=A0AAD0EF96_9RHOB|nr:carbohydrate ABC transporter permease [Phaeobacter gallaeciensis]AHD11912.1 carbohydrate ABC transporter membrane protein 2, CUT1 family [Phaeobacter gallaeciensis DSM 26640]ATE95178.1 carbohydrate ABC transporter membrane protein 2, CUT1 family [Phaeobacter gallaeciensis]ATE99486.1 carbohydrate ABC transporter membrane protein 2, CUT1 family [Phaeobacter gallaeciensis]ATF03883.1 carbohydrate ABC transporter membrane protein 2, CUT1 family [Phaeobacter gallaeciensis]ATF08076.1 carbohydrate 
MFVSKKMTWWAWVGLALALFFAVFPIFWIVSTAFKPSTEWVAIPPVWISEQPTLDNFNAVFISQARAAETAATSVSETGWRAIIGSIIISSCATALSISVGLAASLAISRYRFGGNSTPLMILSGRMFPPIAIAIPFLVMFNSIGLIDTYLGLILCYAAFTLPFSVWMIKSFIDDLPKEIEEAAMLDGLSRIQAHVRFTIPLIRGGLISTSLFIFILNWSEFLFGLVLTAKDVVTIPVQLSKYFAATAGQLYGVQAALAVVAVLPLVVIGYFIQTHLVRGLTFGAVKR